ncbi:MAG: DMT family transporter [Streptosporangiaceae bacterium]
MVGVSESGGGRTSVTGVLLCLIAAVCYATGVVCQKLALRHAPAVQVTAFGCFTGTAACLPFAGQFVSQLGPAPASATLQVVYLGLFPTTVGFTTWAYALARTTSGRMGATIYAVPMLVIILSWLILGQVPQWLAIGGGALCLAGVAVSRSRLRSRLRSRPRADEEAAPQPTARLDVVVAAAYQDQSPDRGIHISWDGDSGLPGSAGIDKAPGPASFLMRRLVGGLVLPGHEPGNFRHGFPSMMPFRVEANGRCLMAAVAGAEFACHYGGWQAGSALATAWWPRICARCGGISWPACVSARPHTCYAEEIL